MTFQKKLRAINRRRYVPSAEGLEGRALQASTGLTLFGAQLTSNLNVPITYEQKAKRIEHLPYYLGQIHSGRFLPNAEIQEIQGALFNMMDSIQKPVPQVLDNFNYQIRQVMPKDSLAPADIAVLNHGVAAVLRNAKAPESSVTGISNGAPDTDVAGRHCQRHAGVPGKQRRHARPTNRPGDRPAHASAAASETEE